MQALYLANPLAVWLIVAGVILVAELATGSGWLLWPAVCAAVVALLTLAGLPLGATGEIIVFAVLTIASTLLARRFIPEGRLRPGPDINDRTGDLVGKRGQVVGAFVDGQGRVLVDGAEWEAEAEGDVSGIVEVVSVLGGARIRVRGA